MKLENSFEVNAPVDDAWALLMDVERVIPCMPGAQLIEVVDESTWKARMDVKLGPIALVFDTDVKQEAADEAAGRITLSARGRERRGRGSAQATIDSLLTTRDGATRVEIVTDLTLAGSVAQYGSGMVKDVSSQLVARFARCLQAQLSSHPEEGSAAVAEASKPIGGLSLGFRAIGRAVVRFFRRIIGRGEKGR